VLRVKARTIVISTGAINSSYLLGKSGIGGPLVGRGLSFNMGSPMTADFDEELHSYDGLQISHVFEPAGEPRWLMETWWNPVLSQAVAMPGWFEDHRRNMLRIRAHDRHRRAGRHRVRRQGRARAVRRRGRGLRAAGCRSARADRGAEAGGADLPEGGGAPGHAGDLRLHEFREQKDLERLDEIVADNSDIQLGTGHPQAAMR
jgi:hypothetical protein